MRLPAFLTARSRQASAPLDHHRPSASVGSSYKAAWNEAAIADARDAILTGASSAHFEATGLADAERVRPYLRGNDTVLNIGCGIGRVDLYLAAHVRELWAIDVSGEMLALARQRLAGLQNIHLVEIDDDEFLRAFTDSDIDLVFSFLVLQHLEKEDALLYIRHTHRVLRPGGVFMAQFPNYLSPEYTRAFFEGSDIRHRSPGRVRVYTEAEIRHTMQIVGFKISDLYHSSGANDDAEIYVAATKK